MSAGSRSLIHYTRLVARTAGEPMNFEKAVRSAIREIDPLQPIFHVQPMNDYVAAFLSGRSFTLTFISLFGAMALLLAAIGIYGVISYSVGPSRRANRNSNGIGRRALSPS